MKRVIQSKTRTNTGAVLALIALVLALGITCPSSAFASVEEGVDVLSEASGAQEQSIVLDTAQHTKQTPDNGSEALETPSGEVAEPNLDTSIEPEKNKPEETTGMTVGQEPAAELPALTGYVFISGSTKVGATLSATVEGAPRRAPLTYQWYRGDAPISGATSTTYTTTNADDDCDISCRVTAAGYEGILISGSIKPALPALTGSVVIVNVSSPDGVEVGDTLAATLNGVQADALLHCQWYRGDTTIEGATSTNYVLVSTDVGQSITCRVTAENYRGVLISSALIPNDQSVTVEYWAYTDVSPDQEVIVHTETVRLSDVFNYRFDQNKDDDSSNDYMGYKLLGWKTEDASGYYDVTLSENEFSTTLQDIATLLGWNGYSALAFHAAHQVRQITVYYWGAGYEEEHDLEPVKVMSWFDAPYLEGLEWKGFLLDSQTDDWGYELDNSMTCGYILTEQVQEPWSDELNIYINWLCLSYLVKYTSPRGISETFYHFYEEVVYLPTSGLLFDYPGHEFVGWYTEPDGAGMQVHNGMRYCDIEPNDKLEGTTLYAHFIQLDLTGTVQVVGGVSVGDTLTVAVDDTPSGVRLQYQWCRGNSPIEGATGTTYLLVDDDAGAEIVCEVRDLNYKGILISNVVGPITGAETQVFAVFSVTDNSLIFYKRAALPAVGEFFSGRHVTAIYADFEDSAIGPWKEYSSIIMSVSVVDKGIKPTNIHYWFTDFSSCIFMDLSKFDTSEVTSMNQLFNGCSSLVSLDISGFSTSQVTNMAGMFAGCSKLTSLNLSHFDIANVSSMTRMFQDCSALVNLVLPASESGTPQMGVLVGMFLNCSSLVEVDLSGIDVTKVRNASGMFEGCASLSTIYVASDADWSNIGTSDGMFKDCTSLVGGNGTRFDAENTNAYYARVDGLDGSPGYFTARPIDALREEVVVGSVLSRAER